MGQSAAEKTRGSPERDFSRWFGLWGGLETRDGAYLFECKRLHSPGASETYVLHEDAERHFATRD